MSITYAIYSESRFGFWDKNAQCFTSTRNEDCEYVEPHAAYSGLVALLDRIGGKADLLVVDSTFAPGSHLNVPHIPLGTPVKVLVDSRFGLLRKAGDVCYVTGVALRGDGTLGYYLNGTHAVASATDPFDVEDEDDEDSEGAVSVCELLWYAGELEVLGQATAQTLLRAQSYRDDEDDFEF